MSREALSLEISQVVSRVVSGDEIDVAEESIMLALKYPDLGMSGEMIGEAIVRAANMVGMIKSAPAPVAWPDDPAVAKQEPPRPAPRGAHSNGFAPRANGAADSIEDEIALAIDAELGAFISERSATPEPEADGDRPPIPAARKPSRSGPLAALRSLFRS